MSDILFWFVLAIIFVLLWWAGYYATKDMRVRKNAMRTEQAKHNLERQAQEQAEAAADIATETAIETSAKQSGDSPTKEQS